MSTPSDQGRGVHSEPAATRPAGPPDGRTTAVHPTTEHPTERHPTDGGQAGRPLLAAQKERYGGIKWGSAFFGWLTATGTALLLTVIAAAAGAALGLAQPEPGLPTGAGAQTAGITAAVVLLVILFLAYYCGGYVAGRMARFNGAKQGVAVWVWAVVVAIAVAVLGTVSGVRFDALADVGGLPRLPIDQSSLTAGTILAALVALAAGLVGAVLGGLAGMRFHRRVDRVVADR